MSTDVQGFVSGLERILSDVHHDALIPGTDETLYVVSRYRDRFERYTQLGLPPHDVVQRALNKAVLATEAQAVGMATPESRVCQEPQEALEAARRFGFPVLVKPVETVVEFGGQLLRHPSRLVGAEQALLEIQRQVGTCIVQRRVEGNVVSLAGVFTAEGVLSSVLVRHHRTWPPQAGSASFVETIALDATLTDRVRALADAIGWRGLCQLQFVEGPGGVLHAIDFNPRLYGCLGVAAAAGAPLAAIWCAALLGETGLRLAGRAGVRWRMEDTDARHALWLLSEGNYRDAAAAGLPRRGTTHAYYRARDPLPLVFRCAQLVQVRWRHARAAR
ncbi:MAG: hypothetical protein ACR2ND_05470 [Solirubrobacteraceae bacterium]